MCDAPQNTEKSEAGPVMRVSVKPSVTHAPRAKIRIERHSITMLPLRTVLALIQ